ncbi:hypothetical protein H0E87_020088, partial [Populus deltoides]
MDFISSSAWAQLADGGSMAGMEIGGENCRGRSLWRGAAAIVVLTGGRVEAAVLWCSPEAQRGWRESPVCGLGEAPFWRRSTAWRFVREEPEKEGSLVSTDEESAHTGRREHRERGSVEGGANSWLLLVYGRLMSEDWSKRG